MSSHASSTTIFLELPVSVVERADLSRLEPSGNAVEVEGVLQLSAMAFQRELCSTYIADAPCNGALLASGGSLVGLALDAQVHDVVAADGAVVDDDIPRP